MKNLLIIDKHQFGDLTDSYKWCEHLRDKYDITIVTLSTGRLKQVKMDGIKMVCAVSPHRTVRGILFTMYALLNLAIAKGKCLIVYYQGCMIFKKLLPWKKMILDIRTLAVDKDERVRSSYDGKIKEACRGFDYVTIISQGLFDKLKLSPHKASVLPLGADSLSCVAKDYTDIHLLYVGTLVGRDVYKTVEAVGIFVRTHPEVALTYDIIGDGRRDEEEYIHQLIENYCLKGIVTMYGRIPYAQLTPYFDKCNVGVSFIPCTPYYDNQPPTKTFEYVLSGLYCIATATISNKQLITKENGLLIDSTVEDFVNALEYIAANHVSFREQEIRNSLKDYTWNKIVDKHLVPVLER